MEAILNYRNMLGKSLLIAGIMGLTAASADLRAQSVGIGFNIIELPQGSSLVSNPFQNGSNLVSDLFVAVPDGFSVSKMIDGGWQSNVWSADSSSWSVPNMSLSPGEGARIDSPSAYQWFTTGKPLVGQLQNWIPEGDSARGSRLALGGLVSTDLGLNAPDGTTLFNVDGDGNLVSVAVFTGGVWVPEEPSLSVGGAFVFSSPSAFEWGQELVVEGIENPLGFALHPSDQTVTEGDSVTLSAQASGADSITYQWQKNGNDIPGATNASFTIEAAGSGDAGQYSVVASTSDAALRSSFATVTVEPVVVEPSTQPSTAIVITEDGLASVTITGTVGELYTVQASTDLGTWVNRATDLANEEGTVVFEERFSNRRPSRFYRVIVQE
jgi:hypothetical protein